MKAARSWMSKSSMRLTWLITKAKNDILKLDPAGELFGAVILAAGWRPDDLEGGDYAHLGYGELPDVITNHQFEAIAKAGKMMRPPTAKPPNRWSSSRARARTVDKDFAYAGAVTSMVALKQAKYVREDYPDGKAYIFYQHMRTTGFSENFYKEMQQDPGIFMTKGPSSVWPKTATA
jgi:quinone-modifying oxidoreductase subunit QmoB